MHTEPERGGNLIRPNSASLHNRQASRLVTIRSNQCKPENFLQARKQGSKETSKQVSKSKADQELKHRHIAQTLRQEWSLAMQRKANFIKLLNKSSCPVTSLHQVQPNRLKSLGMIAIHPARSKQASKQGSKKTNLANTSSAHTHRDPET